MDSEIFNIAYIDGANLHKGMNDLGWELSYQKFRRWLNDKYSVKIAYIFLGFIPQYKNLYIMLQEYGFTLIFKEVAHDEIGKVKGNCDADLVLKVVRDAYESRYRKAIIVSSDGDFASLISFLMSQEKFSVVISPSTAKNCAFLIKRTGAKIEYLSEYKTKLEYVKMKKPPIRRSV